MLINEKNRRYRETHTKEEKSIDNRKYYEKWKLKSGAHPMIDTTKRLGKDAIMMVLESGIGNTLKEKDFLFAGFQFEEIKVLREMYPDSLFPVKEEESGCGCSLLHGELIYSGRRAYAL